MHGKGESEKQTRKKRINAKLEALGWKVAPDGKDAPKGDEVETANGPADYGQPDLLGATEVYLFETGLRRPMRS